ncbi:MAG: DsbC family protein [Gallionella sp.]
MKKIFALLLLTALSSAYAGEKEIRSSLQSKFPDIPLGQITQTTYSGLYEVVIDDQLMYTDAKGDYLFNGSIVETKTRRNLSEERSKVLFAVDFKALPLELAVKRVKGNGKRKMAYFSDPNCSYCEKLEKELVNVTDVTLYIFPYPLFDGSEEIVRNVYCAKDPAKTWSNWMLSKSRPTKTNCDVPIDKIKTLGKKMRVNGTPNLVFADGQQVPGYMPAAALEKRLDEAAKM